MGPTALGCGGVFHGISRLAPMGTTDAIEFLIDKLKQTKTNADFFDSMNT